MGKDSLQCKQYRCFKPKLEKATHELALHGEENGMLFRCVGHQSCELKCPDGYQSHILENVSASEQRAEALTGALDLDCQQEDDVFVWTTRIDLQSDASPQQVPAPRSYSQPQIECA